MFCINYKITDLVQISQGIGEGGWELKGLKVTINVRQGKGGDSVEDEGCIPLDQHHPQPLEQVSWSKQGVGLWLCQKFCECEGQPKPCCCKEGWQTIFCGSRFSTGAESRYHPIEGEALAAAYGLDKCRFFVLGHPDFTLCLNHQPLLAMFGPF